ncbi:MAG TPA: hypothetical protein VG737_12920 [Cyclobacteriaceae bacterium]|nr:hypothetical protein [Cyclobacteriaceae bacterium]
MLVKISKGVWFFSLLGTLGIFLYVYASLPEMVSFDGGGAGFAVSRNGLFYATLGLLAILNAVVFIVAKVFAGGSQYFIAWVYGLVTFFNLFFVVALELVGVSNSQERFDYQRIGYIIYISIALVVIWSAIWPLYRLSQRFSDKQAL